MLKGLKPFVMALGIGALTACGGRSSGTGASNPSWYGRGTLAESPPIRVASVDAVTLLQQLGVTPAGAALLLLAGDPICGIDVYYLNFWTVGGAGEVTKSSGALMVPSGVLPACHGARPIVEYAHGTWTDIGSNIADITNPSNTEGQLIAAMFAAHGYIVVAPNYAGYDISTLGYHPYLDAQQQSGEMMDILTAARTALPTTFTTSTSDNGQLFLTGYSQGGFVAMATLRAMQAAGETVTAAATLSGPYALEAFGDAVFFGAVNLGSTVFSALLANSYQHAYNNIDSTTNPIFSSSYPSAETSLPSTTPINTMFQFGQLPETALFNNAPAPVDIPNQPALSAFLNAALSVPPNAVINPATVPAAAIPVFQVGFGSPYLINDMFRVSYLSESNPLVNPDGVFTQPVPNPGLAKVEPTLGLRQDFYVNDMRNDIAGDGKPWAPAVPTQMCGGDLDPTVYYAFNTEVMAEFWANDPAVLPPLDVSAKPAGPYAKIQGAFQAYQAKQIQGYVESGLSAAAAYQMFIENYHTSVAPFCVAAARAFFSQF